MRYKVFFLQIRHICKSDLKASQDRAENIPFYLFSPDIPRIFPERLVKALILAATHPLNSRFPPLPLTVVAALTDFGARFKFLITNGAKWPWNHLKTPSGLSPKIENCDAVRRTSLSLFVGIGGVVRTTLPPQPVQSALRVDTRCRTRGLSQLLWSCQKGSSCLLTTVIYYRPVWLRVNTECVPENRIYPIILLYLSVALGLSKRAGFLCHPIVFTLKILQNISWLIHTKTMSWSLKSREVSVSISDHLRYVTYPRCLQL